MSLSRLGHLPRDLDLGDKQESEGWGSKEMGRHTGIGCNESLYLTVIQDQQEPWRLRSADACHLWLLCVFVSVCLTVCLPALSSF